ncbi:hypothetical protein Gorai_007493 [Gossypium raimondii]|uniref:DUF4283 domain-containing protein n=1 Tax=Gossypium raimondii TaxID=29730 RepID=A0A7J8Q8R4_GOSRA|nr:hypothetical protein [Gossypium raimondii]
MEDALENLKLLDEEEEAIQEDEGTVSVAYQFCLVGRCLTDGVVHFPSLRNTMTDLWHPIGGICITELGEKRYHFQFFHEVDLERVIAGIPWFFNNHLLILQKVPVGVNPAMMELNHTEFWIQVHNLPPGLMSASMAKKFGDFCGKFIEYDTFIPTLGLQKYLRVRVCLNVTASLKRKKKVLVGKSMVVYARFKYEKLNSFWLGLIVARGGKTSEHGGEQVVTGSKNLAGVKFGNSLNAERDLGLNSKRSGGNLNPNPNLVPLGSDQIQGVGKSIMGRDGCIDALTTDGLVYGPMKLVLDEENDPIALSDGKKRQRIVESSRVLMDANVGSGLIDVSASFDGQSSWGR